MGDEYVYISSDEEISPPPKKKAKLLVPSTGNQKASRNHKSPNNDTLKQVSILEFFTLKTNLPDDDLGSSINITKNTVTSIPTQPVGKRNRSDSDDVFKNVHSDDVLNPSDATDDEAASLLIQRNDENNMQDDHLDDDDTLLIEVVEYQQRTSAWTDDEKKREDVSRLSRALRKLEKRIAKHEDEEVDWDEESNSKYMIAERLKEQAWKLYMKKCEITGENAVDALGIKRIRFDDTNYEKFNRKLEELINEKIYICMHHVVTLSSSLLKTNPLLCDRSC